MVTKPQGRLSNLVGYLYLVNSDEPFQKEMVFITALLLWSYAYLLLRNGNR